MLSGNQCRAKGAHNPGNIRADGFTVGDFFKTPKDRIVVEGAALDYDMTAQFRSIRDLDDFKQGVFDDGIGKSCRNIGDRSSFFLGLFDLGVHKHRTPGAKINGMFCKQGCPGELLYAVI